MAMMNDSLWQNGPRLGSYYQFPGSNQSKSKNDAKQFTLNPTVTGSSVLGIRYDGGVLIAADQLGSYGSLARYKDLERILKVNDCTAIAAGGDYADYQYLSEVLEEINRGEEVQDDGFNLSPKSVHSWLTRVMYNRRSRFNPLWNATIVAGYKNKEPFLGYVDMKGVGFEAKSIAIGMGAHIAQPLLRKAVEENKNLSKEDAEKVMRQCMAVLFYRDARSLNRYQTAMIDENGYKALSMSEEVPTNWKMAHMIVGYE